MLEAFLTSTIAMATPILLAALGELLVEETGIINIGIEGAMLAGAFFALSGVYFTGSVAIGLLCAVAAAITINAMLGALVINLAVNQVVAGTALDILAAGITGVFYRKFFGITGKAFIVTPLREIGIGSLARIPIIGPMLFDQSPLVYFAFILIPVVAWTMRRTRYGLRLRAAGERPEAADALGLRV
ncbi:MAG TPA: ABC transporter permease, partial [Candidatus Binataceae bacterium]|nr:ABC transporter permease [Candidatus Binataceae bacterium]